MMKKLLIIFLSTISGLSIASEKFSEGEVVLFGHGEKKNVGIIKKIDDGGMIQIAPKFFMPQEQLDWRGRFSIAQDQVDSLIKLDDKGINENIKIGKKIVRKMNNGYKEFKLGKIIHVFKDGTIISQFDYEHLTSTVDEEGFYYETNDIDEELVKRGNYALAKPEGSARPFLGRVNAIFDGGIVMISSGNSYLLEKSEKVLLSKDLRGNEQAVLYRENTKVYFEIYGDINENVTSYNKFKKLDDYAPGIVVADFSDEVQFVCGYKFQSSSMNLKDIMTTSEAHLKKVPVLDLGAKACSFRPKEELIIVSRNYKFDSGEFVNISIPSLSSSMANVSDFERSTGDEGRECIKAMVFKEFENGRKMLIFARDQTGKKLLNFSYDKRQIPHYYLTSDEDKLCD